MLLLGTTRKGNAKRRPSREDPFPNARTPKEKLKIVLDATSRDNETEERLRARVYYKADLFMRGYQNLGSWNEENWTYSLEDDEDPMDNTENRFRRNVLINAGSRMRMEPKANIRAASGEFNDLEASKAAEAALEIQLQRVAYNRVKAQKAISQVLFGNSFQFTGWQMDPRMEPLIVPKFSYDSVELEAEAFCPNCDSTAPMGTTICEDCGTVMQDMPSVEGQIKRMAGMESKPNGFAFTAVCTPLEIKIRSNVRGGLPFQPYIQWITAEDHEILEYTYPHLDLPSPNRGGNSFAENSRIRYQQWLSSIPGYIGTALGWGGSSGISGGTTAERNQYLINRAWVQPWMFRGDKDLERRYPEGVACVAVEGKVVEMRPASLAKEWTQEVYILNAHCAYGDGMIDDIPIQHQINRVNQLYMAHLEADTIPLRLYDVDMLVEEDITNDPRKKWIATRVQEGKGLNAAVRDLAPGQLSGDVGQWKSQLLHADQDISGASDPKAGEIAGANTPYAAYVFAVEQGQLRDLPSMEYNAESIRQHAKQLLMVAAEHWTDSQSLMEIDQNTGRTAWKRVAAADLARGEFTIHIRVDDFRPKTRAEAMYGLEYARNFGIDVAQSPKARLEFMERIGLSVEGDMMSTQARRAFRQMEKLIAGGNPQELYHPLIDDGLVQAPVLQEWMATPQGEQLQEDNPEAHGRVLQYVELALQIGAMRAQTMAQMGAPNGAPTPGPQAPPTGTPPAPPAGQPPGGSSAQLAQSPVGEGQKPVLPPNPEVARP